MQSHLALIRSHEVPSRIGTFVKSFTPIQTYKIDGETIHNIRVEIKRIRAVVGVFSGNYKIRTLNKALTNLRHSFKQLSDRRDQDVEKKLLQKYQRKLNLNLKNYEKYLGFRSKSGKKDSELIQHTLNSAMANLFFCTEIISQNLFHENMSKPIKKETRRLFELICEEYKKSKRTKKVKIFHSWREKIKNLYYLLEANIVQMEHSRKLQSKLNRLGNKLGKLHDLCQFEKHLTSISFKSLSGLTLSKLNTALKWDKEMLMKKSVELGKKIILLLPS